MKNWRIALCEDEGIQQRLIGLYLLKIQSETDHAFELYCYESAEQFFMHTDPGDIDILLLDVRLKDMDGFELAEEMRHEGFDKPIIFITGVDDEISRGYDVEALHYLIKPIQYEDFKRVILKGILKAKKAPEIMLEIGREMRVIKQADILGILALGDRILVETIDEELEVNTSLRDIEEELSGFVRTHRSALVNLQHIYRIDDDAVITDHESIYPLSRRKRQSIKEAFMKYHRPQL